MSATNTIYIISKGRPHCTTAKTLIDLDYKGDWFIVCGNNDETLEEYQRNWGDKVLVFDWYERIKETNTMDNFDNTKYASGVPPVREAVRQISEKRGERRHWQFDDDIDVFYIKHPRTRRKLRMNGKILEKYLLKLSSYADKANLSNCGFQYQLHSFPGTTFNIINRVVILHNLPTDKSKFIEWKGRSCDDIINIYDTYRFGGYQISFCFINFGMPMTGTESGGSTEMYEKQGSYRKCLYPLVANPLVKLQFNKDWGVQNNFKKIIPMLIDEDYRKL